MRRTGLCAAALFAIAAAVAGCDDPTGRVCTEIGCSDGLYVTLRYTPSVELEIVASTSAGDERTASCVVNPNGSCLVGFYGFVPEDVTLAVFGGDQPVSVTLQPAYEDFQPNGPGCPPICRQATVEFNLEASAQRS
jgi:hypothetical protein